MATITSVASGYWDQASTWDLEVPSINDDVIIAAGHTVTIRDENAQCLSVTVNATGALVFECSGGPTKISFKDDATAKIINNGTITIQNTSPANKCTWAGGSSANKVDWQTKGTFNQASYWHLEYVKISFNLTIEWNKKVFIDKDVETWAWEHYPGTVITSELNVEPHGEPLTWILGNPANDGVDLLLLHDNIQFNVKGTAAYGVTIRGRDASHKMGDIETGVRIDAKYLTVQNAVYSFFLYGCPPCSFESCSFSGSVGAIRGWGTNLIYFKSCSIAATGFSETRGSWFRFEECNLGGGNSSFYRGNRIDLVGDGNTNPPNWGDRGEIRVFYFKRLTLTVKDNQNNPIANAYVSLIQNHIQDYKFAKNIDDPGLSDSGYTDAGGQVVLYAVHKVFIRRSLELTETIYYSDPDNNGPSGTKEKHLLKVVKEDYWPSQANSYYMSQDRSDTIILTPYTKTVSYGVPELMLLSLIQDNYSILNPPKADVTWLKYPSVFNWDFLLSPKSAGTKTLWVRKEEEPHRPITFKARRVDMNLIVTIFLRAKSRLEADVDEARMQKLNMIEEVRDIVIANGPLSAIADFYMRPKHLINKDDTTQDPPVLAHEVHVQCTYLR